MNIDLEAIKTAVQQFLQDQETLALVGRNALVVVWMIVTGVLGYLFGKLGLGGVRLASWGVRACCKSSPDRLMARELGEAILTSMRTTNQPDTKDRLRIEFAQGSVWLASGQISLNGEFVEELLPWCLRTRIWKEARAIATRLEQDAVRCHKQKLLDVLQYRAKAPAPATMIQPLNQNPGHPPPPPEALPVPDSTGPYPGESEKMSRLRAMMVHAFNVEGIPLNAPLPERK